MAEHDGENEASLPKHVSDGKSSWRRDCPDEDIDGTDMFAPFFRRSRTWLVLGGLALALFVLPIEVRRYAEESLRPGQVRIGLGIFFCIAFLWLTESLPLAATALLVPILASLSGVFDVQTALAPFANPLIFIFFGGFALASAMAYQGIDRWIANRLVIIGKGSLIPVAALLFGATAFLSMWMSNTATTAMMIPLVLGIVRQMGEGDDAEASRRTTIFLLLGVAYSASVGGIGTIIGSPPNGIAAKALDIGFQEWMKFGVPAVIALCAVIALLYFRVVRWRDIDRGTDWGVLLLFGGGLALSATMEETGASLYLAKLFSEGVSGLSVFLIIAAVIAFVIFLTDLSSNTATAALFVPIFAAVAVELGLEPTQLVIALAIAASCAFMLPVATPPNAIVFGTGRIPQRRMMSVGLALNLSFIVVLTLLSQFLF